MIAQPLFSQLLDTGLYALRLFVELAALFVPISFLVGALQKWLPANKTRQYLSARHGRGYLIGALIGAATPFCSCSTVPMTLSLLKSGAGFGPTMTLLFTSPLVNPIIIALFWITFGVELTLLYTAMSLGMAVGVSWLMDRAGCERHLRNDVIGRPTETTSVPLNSVRAAANTQCCRVASNPPVTVTLDTTGIAAGQPAITFPSPPGGAPDGCWSMRSSSFAAFCRMSSLAS